MGAFSFRFRVTKAAADVFRVMNFGFPWMQNSCFETAMLNEGLPLVSLTAMQ